MESLQEGPHIRSLVLRSRDHPLITSKKKTVKRSHDIESEMHAVIWTPNDHISKKHVFYRRLLDLNKIS
jgi:hypothetical protein